MRARCAHEEGVQRTASTLALLLRVLRGPDRARGTHGEDTDRLLRALRRSRGPPCDQALLEDSTLATGSLGPRFVGSCAHGRWTDRALGRGHLRALPRRGGVSLR